MLTAVYYEKGTDASVCQDALLLEYVQKGKKEILLAVVCDGIGGLQQGEFASSFVTGQLKRWFYHDYLKRIGPGFTKKKRIDNVTRVLHEISRELVQYGKQEHIRLGTTLTMMIFCGEKYQLFHMGDSRAYLFPASKNMGQGLLCGQKNGLKNDLKSDLKSGLLNRKKDCRLTKDDVYEKNVLCRCMGSFGWQGIFIKQGKIPKNGIVFLCTDGLIKQVDDREWRAVLNGAVIETEMKLEKRMRKLAREARDRGEKDDQAGIAIVNRRKE